MTVESLDLGSNIEKLEDTTVTGLSPAEEEYEYELQERAGEEPSADFEGVRAKVAQSLYDSEMNELYKASAMNLVDANIPLDAMTQLVNSYNPVHKPEDVNSALLIAGVNKSVAESLALNEETAINAKLNPEIVDTHLLNNDAILEDVMKRTELKIKERSLFSTEGGLLGRIEGLRGIAEAMTPGLSDVKKATAVAATLKNFTKEEITDPVATYKKVREYIRGVMSSDMSYEEKSNTLNGFVDSLIENGLTGLQLEEVMYGAIYGEDWGSFEKFTRFVDVVPFAAISKSSKMLREAKKTGNVTKAKDMISKAALRGDKEILMTDVNGPSVMSPIGGDTISYAVKNDAIKDSLTDERVTNILKSQRPDSIFNEESLKRAKEGFKKEFIKRYGEPLNNMLDIDIVENEQGILMGNMVFGGGMDGKQAITRELAESMINDGWHEKGRWGLLQTDGGYYLKYSKPLTYQTLTSVNKKSELVKKAGVKWFGWAFGGGGFQTSEMIGRGVQAKRLYHGMRDKLIKEFGTSVKKLKRADAALLEDLIAKGRDANGKEGVWYTFKEAAEMTNETVAKAYIDYKRLNDTHYIAMDDLFTRTATAEGFEFFNDSFIGRQLDDTKFTRDMFETTMSCEGLDDAADTFEKISEAIKKGDKVLVELHPVTIQQKNLRYNFALLDKADTKATVIPRGVLPYQAGGIREYAKGTLFIKNGTTMMGRSGAYNGFARTITTSLNRADAQRFVDEGNKIIEYWKQLQQGVIDETQLQKMLDDMGSKLFKADTVADVKKIMRTADNPDGLIDANHPLQVLEHAQDYSYTHNNLKTVTQTDKALDPYMELAITRNRRYNRRGEILDALNGDKAAVLSVKETMDKSIERAAMTNTIQETKRWWQKTFADNFRSVVEDGDKYSDDSLLEYGKLKDMKKASKEDRDLFRAARNFQSRWNIIAGSETFVDKRLNHTVNMAAQYLADHSFGIIKRGDKFYNFLTNVRPDKFLQSVQFITYMGFMNTKQLIKQGIGVTTALALSPVNTTRAMLAYPLVRLAYRFKDNKGIVGEITKRLVQLNCMSKNQVEGLLQFMEDYSSLSATARTPGLAQAHWMSIKNSKILSGMQFFTDMGNNFTYGVADIAAYLAKEKEGFQAIAKYSDDLVLGMSSTGISEVQNVAATFTQWLTYPLRMAEALTGTRFNKKQKLALGMSQLAMWGVGGFTSEQVGTNVYSWLLDDTELTPEQARIIQDGIITYLIEEHSGMRFEGGANLSEVYDKLFDMVDTTTGELKIDVPSVNAISNLSSMLNVVKQTIRASFDDEVSMIDACTRIATDKTAPTGLRTFANVLLWKNSGQWWHYFKGNENVEEDVSGGKVLGYLLGAEDMERHVARQEELLEMGYKNAIKSATDEFCKNVLDDMGTTEYTWEYQDRDLLQERIRQADKFRECTAMAIEAVADAYSYIDKETIITDVSRYMSGRMKEFPKGYDKATALKYKTAMTNFAKAKYANNKFLRGE